MVPPLDRRTLLASGGSTAVLAIAGCLDSSPDSVTPSNDGGEDPDPNLEIGDRYLTSAFPIEFVEPDFEEPTGFAGDARIVYVHWHGPDLSHWHQSPLEVAVGETVVGRTRFLLDGAEEIPLGPGAEFEQTVRPEPGSPESLLSVTVDADHVEITGEVVGETALRFELWSDGDRRWRAPPLPVEIETD